MPRQGQPAGHGSMCGLLLPYWQRCPLSQLVKGPQPTPTPHRRRGVFWLSRVRRGSKAISHSLFFLTSTKV
jgi:hypothetical protein